MPKRPTILPGPVLTRAAAGVEVVVTSAAGVATGVGVTGVAGATDGVVGVGGGVTGVAGAAMVTKAWQVDTGSVWVPFTKVSVAVMVKVPLC